MSWRISDSVPVTAARGPLEGASPAWRRALITGPLAAALVYAAGVLLGGAGLPLLPVAVGCAVLGAGLIVAAILIARTGLAAGFAAVCGAVAAAWLGYAGATTALSWQAALALAAPAVALTWLYPAMRAREERAAEQARAAAEEAKATQAQRRWPDLIARIGHPGVAFASQEATSTGYKVHLRLPGSGRVTYSALAPATERLEVAARLRHGSLRFERGDQAHKVILHVTERDVLAETVPLPRQEGLLSIGGPIPVGVYEDGQICAVTLREIATLIVGLRGAGKTNLLSVLLAQLARCPDVLVFAIDMKGGRMAAPWVEPWLAGRAEQPVIDWLATDREEAERMLRALLRAVDARSRSGSGGDKITPSPRQPAILLICDEIAVILGMGMGGPRTSLEGVTNATLAELATQLVMTGRSEAIDLIMATQRGSMTMTGSADLKSQCALRIGLGVTSEGEARLIIPDDVSIATDLARLVHPGTGIVQQGKTGRVLPVKFYRLEHDQIGAVAQRYAGARPVPDTLLARALGADYATRWSRAPGGPQPADDADHPGRRRMTAMLRAAGVKGMTARGIAEALAADGQEVAQQTVHRWLAEEAAAGRIENATYGRWKALADQ